MLTHKKLVHDQSEKVKDRQLQTVGAPSAKDLVPAATANPSNMEQSRAPAVLLQVISQDTTSVLCSTPQPVPHCEVELLMPGLQPLLRGKAAISDTNSANMGCPEKLSPQPHPDQRSKQHQPAQPHQQHLAQDIRQQPSAGLSRKQQLHHPSSNQRVDKQHFAQYSVKLSQLPKVKQPPPKQLSAGPLLRQLSAQPSFEQLSAQSTYKQQSAQPPSGTRSAQPCQQQPSSRSTHQQTLGSTMLSDQPKVKQPLSRTRQKQPFWTEHYVQPSSQHSNQQLSPQQSKQQLSLQQSE